MGTTDQPPTLEEELRLTRLEIATLSHSRRWQRRMNALVMLLFVLVVSGGTLAYHNAQQDRKALREEACRSDQQSARRARAANEALASAMIFVAVDKDDPAEVDQAERFQEELAVQQARLLPIPECDQ